MLPLQRKLSRTGSDPVHSILSALDLCGRMFIPFLDAKRISS